MRVEVLRKMSKPALQRIADEIARVLEMKVETRFTKGDFIELTGKLKKEGAEKNFALVLHTGNILSEEFLTVFRKALTKENAEALVLTTGSVSLEVGDETLRILSGKALEEFLEINGIGGSEEKVAVPDFNQFAPRTTEISPEKVEDKSALPSAGTLEKYMKMGMKSFEKKEYDKAVQWFDEALRLKPGYDRAISLKARTYAAMGKNDLALEIYRKALEMMPDKYELWYELADLLHQMERFDEELDCYTKILEHNKKLDKVWNNMGIVFFIKEKYEDALYCFERANKLKPSTPDYINNLATAQKKLGKFEEALTNYKKVLEIAPEYKDALLNIGLLYNEMEKHVDAYRTFRKYLSKEKNSSKAWHLAGIAAMNAGAYSQAIKCFEEALKIKPDLKESKEGLKEAKRKFSQKGDKQKISEIEETKVVGGGTSQAVELQTVSQMPEEPIPKICEETEHAEKVEKKRKEETEKTVEEPVVSTEKKEEAAKPGLASLVSAIAKEMGKGEEPAVVSSGDVSDAWVFVKNGEFERAAKEIEGKDVKKKPSTALVAGYVYAGSGNFRQASECFKIVLAQHKMHLPALFGKEFADFSLGDYETSLKTLGVLEKKFPGNPSLALKKCLVLYAKKQFDECEIELKRFAKELQHSEIYWFILGCVNQQKKQKENAIKCFENALKIKPDFAAAMKKIEEMGK